MKQLPHGWRRALIGDVFNVQQGKAVSVKAREGDNIQPFLRTANVFWNGVDLGTVDQMHFSEVEAKKLRLERDDILVCEGGDIGRTAIWKSEIEPCFYQNHLHRLRPKAQEEVDPYFFSLWMQTAILLRGLYVSQGNKTTIPNLSGARLKAFEFPLPPYNVQLAIADILRSVQDAKDTRAHELQLERERKAALMAHLFSHGTRGVATVETPLGKLPRNWEIVRLGELGHIQSGGTPSRAKLAFYGGDIPWLKTLDLNENLVHSTKEKITQAGLKSIRGKIRPIGTVMIAMYGGAGTVGKTGLLSLPSTTNQAVCCIEPNSETFDSFYLLQRMIWMRAEWMRYAIGTRKDPNISKGIIEDFQIGLPPLDEQQEIAAILRACDDKISALEDEATRLEELFRAMLEELMSGRISVAALTESQPTL